MAIMHPSDIENYKYTQSEKKFYDALKEQLPEKYHVFYSVKWMYTVNGVRVNSECDFLVYSPDFGYITIEVKGGVSIEVENGQWTLYEHDDLYDGEVRPRKIKRSPFMQSEESMRYFYEYFKQEFDMIFPGVYGFAVAFPFYNIGHDVCCEGPDEIVIDYKDIKNLANKINSIFHYWKGRRAIRVPFSAEQQRRFINMVHKRVALSAAAGALLPIKEREFKKINIVQDAFIDLLHNYKQAFVIGGAGTGKTWIGIKKAIRSAQMNKKTLFICCSKELKDVIQREVTDYNIDCHTVDSLMESIIGHERFIQMRPENISLRLYFDILSGIDEIGKYDTIVVDEAQDFNEDWALSIRLLLRDERESTLYVFYDKDQNVFMRDFFDGFLIDNPPFVLRYNLRNTGNIYTWTTDKTNLGKETVPNPLLGVEPDYQESRTPAQARKQLNLIVNRLIQKEHVPNRSIVILSDRDKEQSILNGIDEVGAYQLVFKSFNELKDNEINFRTAEQFKGLEADIVICLRHSYVNMPEDEHQKRSQYVAYTRARYYLYIINTILNDG